MINTVPKPSKYFINSSYIDNDLVESPFTSLSLTFLINK